MAETLGSLCDKLTIVKLKQWHSKDPDRLKSLGSQEISLTEEINEFLSDAVAGRIQSGRLKFESNKVYKKEGNEVAQVRGDFGAVFSQLADVNCRLWHEQEKVYDFDKVQDSEKGGVVKQLAVLNLERTRCIEALDLNLCQYLSRNTQAGQ